MSKKLLVVVVAVALFANVASADLVAQWAFDEGAGIIFTDSAGSNHGQAKGAAGAGWIAGSSGLEGDFAYDFTGNSYSDFPAAVLSGNVFSTITTQFSIAFWTMGNPAVASSGNVVMDNAGGIYIGAPNGATSYLFGTSGWANNISWVAGENFDPLAWNHFVLTKDTVAGELKLYVNGALEVTLTNATAPFTGWTQGFETYGMNSALDDLRIYNNAIDLATVQELARVPEPVTLALLGLGGLLLRRRHA